MTPSLAARTHLPLLALVALPLLLALRLGGYHPRHAGWVVMVLTIWACVQAARGRLSAPRSAAGIASMALVALAAWTTASIAWADASTHDAWVEALRATGYAAAFVLAGSLLANARSYARFATLLGAALALLGTGIAVRMAVSDAPLRAFVAGRLDAPIGYAPALAGLMLFTMLLLLGCAGAAEQRWRRAPGAANVVGGALALGGASVCASLALLAQSRGTLPALVVGALVAIAASPDRISWLLRGAVVAGGVAVAQERLAAPYTRQFELRQAPFTEGADEQALLAAAEQAAHAAGTMTLLVAAGAALLGALLVPIGARISTRIHAAQLRSGMRLALPITIAVVALVATLLVLTADRDGSPGAWVADQWAGCVNPPERVNDPGSSTSYFATSGTGRCDYYRVALRSTLEQPLLGLGAGNFRGEYVRERATAEEPRVVHSLPLQLASELGLLGALLGAAVLACVAWAAWRFTRSGAGRDATFAGAVGALGYWTAHASIDWLWQLPAVTLPAVLLAGGLVACVSPPQQQANRGVAAPIAGGLALACIGLVLPVTMADQQLRRARDPQLRERDPAAALTAARDAQSFDPGWAEPAITEAVLQLAAGREAAAAAAARRAVRVEPRSWSVQYRASGLIGLEDRAAGLAAFRAARRLNPSLPATIDAEADQQQRASTDPDSLQNPDS